MEFRVSVCLTHYFNDERSYCYVYLDKTYDTIADFGQYLCRQFHLKNKFCLMTNNNLLPDDQTVKIIQLGDIITVIPLKQNWWQDEEGETTADIVNGFSVTTFLDGIECEKVSKKKKKKKSKSEVTEPLYINEHISLKKEESECPKSIENESSKKRDTYMDVSMGSEEDHDIEQDVVEVDIEQGELAPDENLEESDTDKPGPYGHTESAIQQLKMKALTLLNEVATQKTIAGVSGGRINKRKRIRKRNKNSTLSVSTPDLSDSGSAPPVAFKPVLKSASHIRFDSEQPANFNVHNTVRDSDSTPKPRIIRATESISTSNSRRTSISGFPSLGSCVAGNLAEDLTAVNGSIKTNISRVNKPPINIESIKKRLSEFPVMDDVYPVVTDLIMFKMLKMGSDYTPSYSEFILADVLKVDKSSGFIRVSIRDGQRECIPVSGKFDLEPLSPEEETSTDKIIIDIAWSQVAEPRLILPNLP